MFFYVSTAGDLSQVVCEEISKSELNDISTICFKSKHPRALYHFTVVCSGDVTLTTTFGRAVKEMILLSGKYSQRRRYKPFVGHILYSVLILC